MKGIRTLAVGLSLLLSSCGFGQRIALLQVAGSHGQAISTTTTFRDDRAQRRYKTAALKRKAKHKAAVLRARKRWIQALLVNQFLTALAKIPASKAVEAARAQLGKPYVYAASGPNSFDCSGLTMFAWAVGGVSLPHNAAAQFYATAHVEQSQLIPGDLVYFGSPIHHMGIFVGNGMMIEAPHTGAFVRYHSIYRNDYAGGSRPS